MLICSPATITSEHKIIIGWIPFLHRSIMLSPLRYLNEKCNVQSIPSYNNLDGKIESNLSHNAKLSDKERQIEVPIRKQEQFEVLIQSLIDSGA
jgi:hypothetical protein